MSKLNHKVAAVTAATLATELQAFGSTASTTTSTNCSKTGLNYTMRKDPRTVTTTAVPITTGGSGNLSVTVVNDSETTVA